MSANLRKRIDHTHIYSVIGLSHMLSLPGAHLEVRFIVRTLLALSALAV